MASVKLPEGVPAEDVVDRSKGGTVRAEVESKSDVPRGFYISQKDAEKHGCGGCSSWFMGFNRWFLT